MRAVLLTLVALVVGCGGTTGTAPTSGGGSTSFDARAFLEEVADAETDLLTAPDRSVEDLMDAREGTSGAARRAIFRDLARAHLALARTTEGREARRHREQFDRFRDQATNGSRDEHLNAEMDFLEIWAGWENEARNVATRAERFTNRHETSGVLLVLTWMIRGELALAANDWQGARDAFRFVLGQLGHPLYAYALYRTAFAWHSAGDDEQARQALEEAAALGCDADVPEPTRRMALLSAAQLDVGRRDEGGHEVPASCPERTAGSEDTGGWRPPE